MVPQALVQLSDLHIVPQGQLAYGRVDTAAFLQRAIAAVGALPQRPDAVVITGDLTDLGTAAEYARLRELLRPLAVPTYLMMGNHDDRAALRAQFPDHAYLGTSGFVQYAVDIGALRLIALDSIVAGASHGELCGERLQWLDRQLAQSAGRPVVIAMHHPPFPTLIGHMDHIGLQHGAAEMAAIVARYPNVERVIAGHLHRPIEARFGGTFASTAPSPAHQVLLDFDDAAPARLAFEPPAFRLHAWTPASGLISHLVPIGPFEGPFRFH